MLKVRDIMTRHVVTLSPDLTLEQASGVFAQRHISGAPVIASGRVVGVVSQSDILEFAASARYVRTPRCRRPPTTCVASGFTASS
jgi:chloride channel protein, CIC family